MEGAKLRGLEECWCGTLADVRRQYCTGGGLKGGAAFKTSIIFISNFLTMCIQKQARFYQFHLELLTWEDEIFCVC